VNGHAEGQRPLPRTAPTPKNVPVKVFAGTILNELCDLLNLGGSRGTVLARDFARLNGQNFFKDVCGNIELADTSDKPNRGWHTYLPF